MRIGRKSESRLWHNDGFTLVEVLAVIVIISVLIGFVLGIGTMAIRKSEVAQAESQLKRIEIGLENYRVAWGMYPVATQDNPSISNNTNLIDTLYWDPIATTNLPYVDVKHHELSGPTSNRWLDPWGNFYRYRHDRLTNGIRYELYSAGIDGQDGTSDDLRNY